MITFEQLEYACRVCHNTHKYFLRMGDWATKRQHVALYLLDLPTLLDAYAKQTKKAHPTNPRAIILDAIPGLVWLRRARR